MGYRDGATCPQPDPPVRLILYTFSCWLGFLPHSYYLYIDHLLFPQQLLPLLFSSLLPFALRNGAKLASTAPPPPPPAADSPIEAAGATPGGVAGRSMGSSDQKVIGIAAEEEGRRCCVECRATTTPMWRGGPTGPRSLCNACGIRYRKKRRQELGLDNKQQQQHPQQQQEHPHQQQEHQQQQEDHSDATSSVKDSSSSSSNKSSNLQVVKKRRVLMGVEEAAILLMTLSSSSTPTILHG